MIMTLGGTSFNQQDFPINKGDKVTVVREKDNPDDHDSHPAYAVMIEGARIGYIPKVEPIKAKQLQARQNNDLKAWERFSDKVNVLEYLRDCIYTDLTRNYLTPTGEVYGVRWLDGKDWNEEGRGERLSISVIFDYQ